mgnify:CR=1 FL=1
MHTALHRKLSKGGRFVAFVTFCKLFVNVTNFLQKISLKYKKFTNFWQLSDKKDIKERQFHTIVWQNYMGFQQKDDNCQTNISKKDWFATKISTKTMQNYTNESQNVDKKLNIG